VKSKIVNLVVVAHPDDEILGFGAAGAKLVFQGEVVQPIILCGNVDARTHRPTNQELYDDMVNANKAVGFEVPELGQFPNIKMNTVPHLEVVQFIEKMIEKYQPTRIFTHHPSDLNNDHEQVSKACLAASRLWQRRADVLPLRSLSYMEVLSATDWAFPSDRMPFQPNQYVEVEEFIDSKIQALGCYRNVMRAFPHPRSEEIVKGLAAYRGGQSGQRYSEAFQTVFLSEF